MYRNAVRTDAPYSATAGAVCQTYAKKSLKPGKEAVQYYVLSSVKVPSDAEAPIETDHRQTYKLPWVPGSQASFMMMIDFCILFLHSESLLLKGLCL